MDTPAPSPHTSQNPHPRQPGAGEIDVELNEKEHRYPVEFRGRGSEYFKIWIVNVALTIITFYVYSAWAKVRNKRYFYGNTYVDNSSFDYHALGGQIFTGRVIAILVLILVSIVGAFFPIAQIVFYVLLLLLIPWIIWRSIIFNARMSSYRNVRYGFTKRVGGLYWAILKCILVTMLILALVVGAFLLVMKVVTGDTSSSAIMPAIWQMIIASLVLLIPAVTPWLHRNLNHFALNGYRFGTANFKANLSTGKYYAAYIGSMAVAMGLYILFALPFVIAGFIFRDGIPGIGPIDQLMDRIEGALQPGSPHFPLVLAVAAFFYLLLIFIGLVSSAYLRAKLRNYRYQQTIVGDRVRVQSTVRTWPFAWLLFTNLLLVVVTVGFALPWTRVRVARFLAANTMVTSKGTLDGIVSVEEKRISSLGDELGEAFDVDFELGL